MIKNADLLTTRDVSKILGIAISTVNKRATDGRIPAAMKLPGSTGAYLFERQQIEALKDNQGAKS